MLKIICWMVILIFLSDSAWRVLFYCCFFWTVSRKRQHALQDYLLIQQYVRVKKDIFKMPTKDVRAHDTQLLDHIWLVLSTLKRWIILTKNVWVEYVRAILTLIQEFFFFLSKQLKKSIPQTSVCVEKLHMNSSISLARDPYPWTGVGRRGLSLN